MRLPLRYARNSTDRLPRIMQVCQCTVALDALHWTRLYATAWDMAPVDAHLENAAALVLSDETRRDSLEGREGAQTSSELPTGVLHASLKNCTTTRTPCPGHAIAVLVTCLPPCVAAVSTIPAANLRYFYCRPANSGTIRAASGVIAHFPRLRALVTPRISRASRARQDNSTGRQTHHPCLHVSLTWETHADTGGVSDGVPRKAASTEDGATMER